MDGWQHGPMASFDIESTGIDVEADRIVTVSTVHIEPGRPVDTTAWMVNPGVEIPQAATDVHGITTEQARRQGRNPADVLAEVTAVLWATLNAGTPIVCMNVVYDLTLLDRECRRHGVPTLGEMLHGEVRPVVDVRLLDKQLDRYRPGKRRLLDLCEHYGVTLDGAHDSTHDALAAARVAWKIATLYPRVGGVALGELHDAQVRWAVEQERSFADYLRRQQALAEQAGRAEDASQLAKRIAGMDCGGWPVRPLPEPTPIGARGAAT